jgi:hypothetical protein
MREPRSGPSNRNWWVSPIARRPRSTVPANVTYVASAAKTAPKAVPSPAFQAAASRRSTSAMRSFSMSDADCAADMVDPSGVWDMWEFHHRA